MLDFYGFKLDSTESGAVIRCLRSQLHAHIILSLQTGRDSSRNDSRISTPSIWRSRHSLQFSRRYHNNLRITRILKFLGEVGLEVQFHAASPMLTLMKKFKLPWLEALAVEVFREKTLPNLTDSFSDYFAKTLRSLGEASCR